MALQISEKLIKPLRNNFVERPWGGTMIRQFKQMCELPDQRIIGGAGLGEVFEIAAYDQDTEAARFPSRIRTSDGSYVSLPELLRDRGDELLGDDFVARHGRCFPLLPKYLDIRELLSVQGHPIGNTEAYIVVAAEPGATIRLGFNQDVDRAWIGALLADGRRKQNAVLGLLDSGADISTLQEALRDWFAANPRSAETTTVDLGAWIASARDRKTAVALLNRLKEVYWSVLDLMNEIEVHAGQVVYNANPARITAMTGQAATAEVHALGNPERREIVALEIRRPGPTLRAWDNVRFPLRDIDIDGALDVLNLDRTEPAEFLAERLPIAGRHGVMVSVDCEYFRIEHLMPAARQAVQVPQQDVHCLHVLSGRTGVENADGTPIGELGAGESALVPIGVGAYRAKALAEPCEIIKVSLPK